MKKLFLFFSFHILSKRLGLLQNDIIASPLAFTLGQNRSRISKQILEPPTKAIRNNHPQKGKAVFLVEGQFLR